MLRKNFHPVVTRRLPRLDLYNLVKTAAAKRSDWQQALKRVGDNLYRSDASKVYYAIFK